MDVLVNEISMERLEVMLKGKSCMCFTGRRPKDLCGYRHENYSAFVKALHDLIYEKYYKDLGIRVFVTGGAQGFDQLAFWAVAHMVQHYMLNDVTNIVFGVRGQDRRWKDTGAFSREEYRLMLARASYVCWVTDYAEQGIAALHERNHIMADHACCLLALYPDNTWTTSKGGTAECLRYAAAKNWPAKSIARLEYKIENGDLLTGSICYDV